MTAALAHGNWRNWLYPVIALYDSQWTKSQWVPALATSRRHARA